MVFWSKSAEEVLKSLASSHYGLSELEAKKRLSIYRFNDIPKRLERS
jgi:hypothetical protein